MNEFEININVEEKDYKHFCEFHIGNSFDIQTLLLSFVKINFIILIAFFIVPQFFSIDDWFSEISDLYPYFFATFIELLYLFIFQKKVKSKALKKHLINGKEDRLIGKLSLLFNNEKIIEKSVSGEIVISLPSIVKILFDEKYYFIYLSSVTAYIVPKNEKYNQHIEELIEYIKK